MESALDTHSLVRHLQDSNSGRSSTPPSALLVCAYSAFVMHRLTHTLSEAINSLRVFSETTERFDTVIFIQQRSVRSVVVHVVHAFNDHLFFVFLTSMHCSCSLFFFLHFLFVARSRVHHLHPRLDQLLQHYDTFLNSIFPRLLGFLADDVLPLRQDATTNPELSNNSLLPSLIHPAGNHLHGGTKYFYTENNCKVRALVLSIIEKLPHTHALQFRLPAIISALLKNAQCDVEDNVVSSLRILSGFLKAFSVYIQQQQMNEILLYAHEYVQLFETSTHVYMSSVRDVAAVFPPVGKHNMKCMPEVLSAVELVVHIHPEGFSQLQNILIAGAYALNVKLPTEVHVDSANCGGGITPMHARWNAFTAVHSAARVKLIVLIIKHLQLLETTNYAPHYTILVANAVELLQKSAYCLDFIRGDLLRSIQHFLNASATRQILLQHKDALLERNGDAILSNCTASAFATPWLQELAYQTLVEFYIHACATLSTVQTQAALALCSHCLLNQHLTSNTVASVMRLVSSLTNYIYRHLGSANGITTSHRQLLIQILHILSQRLVLSASIIEVETTNRYNGDTQQGQNVIRVSKMHICDICTNIKHVVWCISTQKNGSTSWSQLDAEEVQLMGHILSTGAECIIALHNAYARMCNKSRVVVVSPGAVESISSLSQEVLTKSASFVRDMIYNWAAIFTTLHPRTFTEVFTKHIDQLLQTMLREAPALYLLLFLPGLKSADNTIQTASSLSIPASPAPSSVSYLQVSLAVVTQLCTTFFNMVLCRISTTLLHRINNSKDTDTNVQPHNVPPNTSVELNWMLALYRTIFSCMETTTPAEQQIIILKRHVRELTCAVLQLTETSGHPFNLLTLLKALYRGVGNTVHHHVRDEIKKSEALNFKAFIITILNVHLASTTGHETDPSCNAFKNVCMELCFLYPVDHETFIAHMDVFIRILVMALRTSDQGLVMMALQSLDRWLSHKGLSAVCGMIHPHVLSALVDALISIVRDKTCFTQYQQFAHMAIQLLGRFGGYNRTSLREPWINASSSSSSNPTANNNSRIQYDPVLIKAINERPGTSHQFHINILPLLLVAKDSILNRGSTESIRGKQHQGMKINRLSSSAYGGNSINDHAIYLIKHSILQICKELEEAQCIVPPMGIRRRAHEKNHAGSEEEEEKEKEDLSDAYTGPVQHEEQPGNTAITSDEMNDACWISKHSSKYALLQELLFCFIISSGKTSMRQQVGTHRPGETIINDGDILVYMAHSADMQLCTRFMDALVYGVCDSNPVWTSAALFIWDIFLDRVLESPIDSLRISEIATYMLRKFYHVCLSDTHASRGGPVMNAIRALIEKMPGTWCAHHAHTIMSVVFQMYVSGRDINEDTAQIISNMCIQHIHAQIVLGNTKVSILPTSSHSPTPSQNCHHFAVAHIFIQTVDEYMFSSTHSVALQAESVLDALQNKFVGGTGDLDATGSENEVVAFIRTDLSIRVRSFANSSSMPILERTTVMAVLAYILSLGAPSCEPVWMLDFLDSELRNKDAQDHANNRLELANIRCISLMFGGEETEQQKHKQMIDLKQLSVAYLFRSLRSAHLPIVDASASCLKALYVSKGLPLPADVITTHVAPALIGFESITNLSESSVSHLARLVQVCPGIFNSKFAYMVVKHIDAFSLVDIQEKHWKAASYSSHSGVPADAVAICLVDILRFLSSAIIQVVSLQFPYGIGSIIGIVTTYVITCQHRTALLYKMEQSASSAVSVSSPNITTRQDHNCIDVALQFYCVYPRYVCDWFLQAAHSSVSKRHLWITILSKKEAEPLRKHLLLHMHQLLKCTLEWNPATAPQPPANLFFDAEGMNRRMLGLSILNVLSTFCTDQCIFSMPPSESTEAIIGHNPKKKTLIHVLINVFGKYMETTFRDPYSFSLNLEPCNFHALDEGKRICSLLVHYFQKNARDIGTLLSLVAVFPSKYVTCRQSDAQQLTCMISNMVQIYTRKDVAFTWVDTFLKWWNSTDTSTQARVCALELVATPLVRKTLSIIHVHSSSSSAAAASTQVTGSVLSSLITTIIDLFQSETRTPQNSQSDAGGMKRMLICQILDIIHEVVRYAKRVPSFLPAHIQTHITQFCVEWSEHTMEDTIDDGRVRSMAYKCVSQCYVHFGVQEETMIALYKVLLHAHHNNSGSPAHVNICAALDSLLGACQQQRKWIDWTQQILHENSNDVHFAIHLCNLIKRNVGMFYNCRVEWATFVVNMASKVGASDTRTLEQRRMALNFLEILLNWEEETNKQIYDKQQTTSYSTNHPVDALLQRQKRSRIHDNGADTSLLPPSSSPTKLTSESIQSSVRLAPKLKDAVCFLLLRMSFYTLTVEHSETLSQRCIALLQRFFIVWAPNPPDNIPLVEVLEEEIKKLNSTKAGLEHQQQKSEDAKYLIIMAFYTHTLEVIGVIIPHLSHGSRQQTYCFSHFRALLPVCSRAHGRKMRAVLCETTRALLSVWFCDVVHEQTSTATTTTTPSEGGNGVTSFSLPVQLITYSFSLLQKCMTDSKQILDAPVAMEILSTVVSSYAAFNQTLPIIFDADHQRRNVTLLLDIFRCAINRYIDISKNNSATAQSATSHAAVTHTAHVEVLQSIKTLLQSTIVHVLPTFSGTLFADSGDADLRRSFVQSIMHLIDNTNDDEILLTVIKMIHPWVCAACRISQQSTHLSRAVRVRVMLSVGEVLQCITKLCKVDRLPSERTLHAFLDMILECTDGIRRSISNNVEPPLWFDKFQHTFLIGLRCRTSSYRKQFFHILQGHIGATPHDRIHYIFGENTYSFFHAHADEWLTHACDVLLTTTTLVCDDASTVLNTTVYTSDDEYADPRNGRKRTSAVLLLQPHGSRTQALSVKTTCFNTVSSTQFTHSLREVIYESFQMAQRAWCLLFPQAWTQTHVEIRPALVACIIRLLSHDWLASAPEIQILRTKQAIRAVLAGIHECYPMPVIPPQLLQWLAIRYDAHHECILIMEKLKQDTSVSAAQNAAYTDTLAAVYRSIGEVDMWYELWYTRVFTADSRMALAYAQYGLWNAAQDTYAHASQKLQIYESDVPAKARKGETNSSSPFLDVAYASGVEKTMWQQEWVQCAKQLNQWDVLKTFSVSAGHVETEWECAWRLGNWKKVRELGTKVFVAFSEQSRTSCHRACVFQASLNIRDRIVQSKSTLVSTPISTPLSTPTSMGGTPLVISKQPSKRNALVEANKYTEMSMQQLILDFQSLTGPIGNAHVGALHRAHQLVEIAEANYMVTHLTSTASTTNVSTDSTKHFLTLVSSWKERNPNTWDDLSVWHDVYAWRWNFLRLVMNHELVLPSAQEHSLDTVMAFVRTARKQNLICVAEKMMMQQLLSVTPSQAHTEYAVVRENIKIAMLSRPDHSYALKCVMLSDLTQRNDIQRAELFHMKAKLMQQDGVGDEAHNAYSAAVSILASIEGGEETCVIPRQMAKTWTSWGSLCAKVFSQKKSTIWRDNALVCYINAISCNPEYAWLNVPRILCLLPISTNDLLEEADRTFVSLFHTQASSLPAHVWIPWLPQLLSLIPVFSNQSPGSNAGTVLHHIANTSPQGLFWSIRSRLRQERVQMDKNVAATTIITITTADAVTHTNPLLLLHAVYSRMQKAHPEIVAQLEKIAFCIEHHFTPSQEELLHDDLEQLSNAFYCTDGEIIDAPLVSALHVVDGKTMANLKALYVKYFSHQHSHHGNTTKQDISAHTEFIQKYKKCFEADFYTDEDGVARKLLSPEHFRSSIRRWLGYLKTRSIANSCTSLQTCSPYLYRYTCRDPRICIEVPGQYAAGISEVSPPHKEVLHSFSPLVASKYVPGKQYGKIIGMMTTEGTVRRFRIQKLTGSITTTTIQRDVLSTQLLRVINRIARSNKETSKRHVGVCVREQVPVTPDMVLVTLPNDAVNVQELYENDCTIKCVDSTTPWNIYRKSLLKETASSSIAPPAVTYHTNKKHVWKLEAFDRVTNEHVSDTLLHAHLSRNTVSAQTYWELKRRLCTQLALYSVLSYVTHVGSQAAHNFTFSIIETTIVCDQRYPEYNKKDLMLGCHEYVPFRLTRNLQTALGLSMLRGVFGASMMATLISFAANKDVLETYLRLYIRNDSQLAYPGADVDLDKSTTANVTIIMKRVMDLVRVPSRGGDASSDAPHEIVLPLNHKTRALLSMALSKQNIARMPASWSPWL